MKSSSRTVKRTRRRTSRMGYTGFHAAVALEFGRDAADDENDDGDDDDEDDDASE